MLKNILLKISRPFPYSRGLVVEIKTASIVCLMIVVIIHLMNPSSYRLMDLSQVLGFIIVALISIVFNLSIWSFVIKKIVDTEKWTVWKEIIKSLCYLYVNAIALFYYISLVSLHEQLTSIIQLAFYSIIIAIVPIGIRINSIHIWLLKKKLDEAKKLNQAFKKTKPIINKTAIVIKSNIVNDSIQTSAESLIYIKAEQNYINVFFISENVIKQKLIRISLIKALDQINDEFIVRCHRSYIVNLRYIKNVTGNAQCVKLILKEEEFKEIPVSKSFITEFINYQN